MYYSTIGQLSYLAEISVLGLFNETAPLGPKICCADDVLAIVPNLLNEPCRHFSSYFFNLWITMAGPLCAISMWWYLSLKILTVTVSIIFVHILLILN